MEIEAYALEVGRMPAMLQDGVRQVWIMKGDMPWGGGPGNGGDILRHVLIHTGKGQTYRGQGVVVETLIHEVVHAVLVAAIYSLSLVHYELSLGQFSRQVVVSPCSAGIFNFNLKLRNPSERHTCTNSSRAVQ